MRLLDDAGEKLDAHTYPATTDELIEAYGDLELQLPNGTETLGDALAHMPSETFRNEEEARFTAYSAVSSKAIGRKGYSDRDPVCPGEDGPGQVSF
jgi:hypothetical protein